MIYLSAVCSSMVLLTYYFPIFSVCLLFFLVRWESRQQKSPANDNLIDVSAVCPSCLYSVQTNMIWNTIFLVYPTAECLDREWDDGAVIGAFQLATFGGAWGNTHHRQWQSIRERLVMSFGTPLGSCDSDCSRNMPGMLGISASCVALTTAVAVAVATAARPHGSNCNGNLLTRSNTSCRTSLGRLQSVPNSDSRLQMPHSRPLPTGIKSIAPQ